MIRLSSALALAGGLATGAGLMYLLDPDLGKHRRSRAQRKLSRATRSAARAAVAARESAQELGEKATAALKLNGHKRSVLRLPRSRVGKVAVGTLAAAALAGGTLAAVGRTAAN